jgi:hypothetical protein
MQYAIPVPRLPPEGLDQVYEHEYSASSKGQNSITGILVVIVISHQRTTLVISETATEAATAAATAAT